MATKDITQQIAMVTCMRGIHIFDENQHDACPDCIIEMQGRLGNALAPILAGEPHYDQILDIPADNRTSMSGSDKESDEALDSDPDLLSFAQIYQHLLRESDIIVEIGEEDFNKLKDGVSNAKHHANLGLEKAGKAKDKRRVDYSIIETIPEEHTIKVRIWFKAAIGLSVKSIQPTRGV